MADRAVVVAVLAVLTTVAAIRVPTVWPKDDHQIYHGSKPTTPPPLSSSPLSSSYPWIPSTRSQNALFKVRPVKQQYYNPYYDPEKPREVPTRPLYPGEGVWAKPIATKHHQHRPYQPPEPKKYYRPAKLHHEKQPDGYDTFLRGKKRFNKARKKYHTVLKPPEPYAEPPLLDGFIPIKSYAQVRRTETKKHLPHGSHEDSEDAEEAQNQARLKEIIRDTKSHTVYTEEGYEDSAYDHAGHEKAAEESEKHSAREDGGTRSKARGHFANEDSSDLQQGSSHGSDLVDHSASSGDRLGAEDHADHEAHSAHDADSSGSKYASEPQRWGKTRLAKETQKTTIKDLGDGSMDMEITSEIKVSDDPSGKREKYVKIAPKKVKIFKRPVAHSEVDDLLAQPNATASRRRRSIDDEKYPYYRKIRNQPLLEHSPLKYAENLRNMPIKAMGKMAFYDLADSVECPEVDEEPDPVPDRIKNQKEGEETGNAAQPPNGARLSGLGDKIDCFKRKYFGDNPLDNPLFKEELIEPPKIPKFHVKLLPELSRAESPPAEKLLEIKLANRVESTTPPAREPKISDFISNLTSIADDAPEVEVNAGEAQGAQIEEILRLNKRNSQPSNLVADPKNFAGSEVSYKDEIRPDEQINVYSDVLKTIFGTRNPERSRIAVNVHKQQKEDDQKPDQQKNQVSQELLLKELVTMSRPGNYDLNQKLHFEFDSQQQPSRKQMNYYPVTGMRPPAMSWQLVPTYAAYMMHNTATRKRNKRAAARMYTEIRTLNRKLPKFREKDEDDDEDEEAVVERRRRPSLVTSTEKPKEVDTGYLDFVARLKERRKHKKDEDSAEDTTEKPTTTTQKLIVVTKGQGDPAYLKFVDKLKEWRQKIGYTDAPEEEEEDTTDAVAKETKTEDPATRTLLPPSSDKNTTPLITTTTTERAKEDEFPPRAKTKIDYSKYVTIERAPVAMRHNLSSRYNSDEDDLPLDTRQTTQAPIFAFRPPPVMTEPPPPPPPPRTTTTTARTTTVAVEEPKKRRVLARRRNPATTSTTTSAPTTRVAIARRRTPLRTSTTSTTPASTTTHRHRRRRPTTTSTPSTTSTTIARRPSVNLDAAESINPAYHNLLMRRQKTTTRPPHMRLVPANHKETYVEVTTSTTTTSTTTPKPTTTTTTTPKPPRRSTTTTSTTPKPSPTTTEAKDDDYDEAVTEQPRKIHKYQKQRVTTEYVETSVFDPDEDAEDDNDELESEHDDDSDDSDDSEDFHGDVEVFSRVNPQRRHGGNYRRAESDEEGNEDRYADIVPRPASFYTDPALAKTVNQLDRSLGQQPANKYPNLAKMVNKLSQ